MNSGWIRLCLFGLLVLVVGSLTSGSPPQHGQDAAGTVHAYGAHKLLVLTEDRPAQDRLARLGVIQRQIDYGSFRVLVVGDRAIPALAEEALSNVAVRDDFDVVSINRWAIDTREGEPKDLPADRLEAPGIHERQLYLVQFVGPAKDEWLADLKGHRDLDVVAYLPNNAYAVFASPAAWTRMSSEASRPGSAGQWAAPYHPAYRVSANLEEAIARGDRSVDVVVQIVEHPGAERTVADLKKQALAQLMDDVSLGGLRDVRVSIPAGLITALAARTDVFWIEPCSKKIKLDESQSQIVAGNLDAGGTQPSSPGYLSWLNGKGFTSNFPFTVDVADDGIDRGSLTDVHQDFTDAGGVPRVAYALNYTGDAAADSGDGHGNINAAIIGGYNNIQGNTSYEDAGGYQYGLGIAPYTLVGASKIFGNNGAFTSAAFTTLIRSAYMNGARISSNSWGDCLSNCTLPDNTYNTDSRTYDFLVRDVEPWTATHEPMTIVFAAGNDGSAANTVTAPGTAKNVITVGASENYRQTGTDGCGIANVGADSAKDIISFSSRGPASDGRKKPDLMAPGTHVQGAASRSVNYDALGVCNFYWPSGQSLYTWSSGTSHSTPAVAGAAALARQWFANKGWGTPSPAMIKAFLLASPTHMTGVGANDTLPSNNQGYGRLNLGRAFDGAANIRVDQTQVLSATGQTYTASGTVGSSTLPFRVMLAWTDQPGTPAGNAWVNNLDLEVTVNGTLYRGNVFSGANSATGGTADTRNNTEAVFLPAGTTGSFSIIVRATGINGDGIPGNGDSTDQDFALFVYNGSRPEFTLAASPSSYTVVQGGPTSFAVTVGSANGFSSSTTLSVSGLPSGATALFSPNPVTPPSGGSVGSTVSITTSGVTPAGVYPLTITGASGTLTTSTMVTLTVLTQVLSYYATPALAIPDNNATGVTSTITVPASLMISSVSVYVNITHPSIGDLEVSIIGPDSTSVILHNRTGGSADNIVTTYDATTESSGHLWDLANRNSSGNWTLKVRDLAAGNVGTINSWHVTFSGYWGIYPGEPIPDNSTAGITGPLNVLATGKVDNMRVQVFLNHARQSDLEVSLIGPDGTTVLLHNRTGTGGFYDKTYPDVDTPAQSLSALTGKEIAGTWTLKVRDLAPTFEGTGSFLGWFIDFGTQQGIELTLIERPISDAGPNEGIPTPSGPHYQNVDDDPNDGDSTMLAFSSGGLKEVYTKEAQLLDSDRITSVKVRWVAKKGGGGTYTGKAGLLMAAPGVCPSGECYGPVEVLAPSYSIKESVFPVNPATSQPWTVADVRAAKLIYQQVSIDTALPRARLSEIVLVITLGRVPVSTTLTELPNSDAGPNEGTPTPSGPHYLNVDDDPNDGDSTILAFASGGYKEVYTTADQLLDSDHVTSVKVRWVAKKGAGSGYQAKAGLVMATPGVCPAGECYGPVVTLTAQYSIREETFLANPATGQLWTVQDVRSAKPIYQQVSIDTQLPRARLTEMVLVIAVDRLP